MKDVKNIVYRFLTDAEFFNIYKPPRTEAGGGGQTYIDFQTTFIPVARWHTFFSGVKDLKVGTRANGPEWRFPVHSIGVPPAPPQQILMVYQRRPASVCISSQYIHSKSSNRVHAWHPSNGFPQPGDSADRHQLPDGLAVFIARTFNHEVWAGWFNANDPVNRGWADAKARLLLSHIFAAARQPGDAGMLTFKQGQLRINTNDSKVPLTGGTIAVGTTLPAKKPKVKKAKKKTKPRPRRVLKEKELLDVLFYEDEADPATVDTKQKTITVKIKQRNQRAVKRLKQLYGNRCQISGARLTFRKQDGIFYSEAHHLLPLGDGGADDPCNMIIVSPLIHKMLHYASVEGIDLTQIKQQPSGEGVLKILINGEDMVITWHAEHAKRILET
jgi:5-methylcytosine-specific restriction protein A